ncbi:hypothetical protein [Collimonas arenae]|nr:hypothetical protein [Collimonas arenae]
MTGYYRTDLPIDCFENSTSRHVCHVEQGLNIKRRNESSYYLWIHTEGNYNHFCSFQGIAQIKKGLLVSNGDNCKVSVEIKGRDASVGSAGEGCANYCGANVELVIDGLKKK